MAQRTVKLLEKLKSEDKIITESIIIESLNLIGSCYSGKVGVMAFKYIKDNFNIFKSDTLLKNHLDTTSNLMEHYH